MSFALKGFIIGLAIAAPVGPIGVLCIRRTLAAGRMVGFLSGLGAATADMIYGAIAAFGLTAVQAVLVGQQYWLRLIGGTFLLYLGASTFLARPAASAAQARTSTSPLSAYLSTLGLTLTNPATIISFTVVFAGLQLADTHGNAFAATALVVGVFLGSVTWWLALSGMVGLLRERFSAAWMLWVNRLAGAIIFAFGAAAVLTA